MLNYFLRSLIKGKVWHYLPGDIAGRGVIKKVSNGDIGEGGIYKIWYVCGEVIFEWSLMSLMRIASTLIQPPPTTQIYK